MWYWHQDKHIDLYNQLESPEINPNIYGQLISTRVSKLVNRKRLVSLTDEDKMIRFPYAGGGGGGGRKKRQKDHIQKFTQSKTT